MRWAALLVLLAGCSANPGHPVRVTAISPPPAIVPPPAPKKPTAPSPALAKVPSGTKPPT